MPIHLINRPDAFTPRQNAMIFAHGLLAGSQLRTSIAGKRIPSTYIGEALNLEMQLAISRAASEGVRIKAFAANSPKVDTPVPDSWLAPVEEFVAELIRRVDNPRISDTLARDLFNDALDRMPNLLQQMDTNALARTMEASMGRAALAEIVNRSAKLKSLSAEPGYRIIGYATPPAIDFAPILEAAARLDKKIPLAVDLSSAEWADVALGIRERSQFSAHVTSVRFLAELQDKLRKRATMSTEVVFDGKVNREAFVDRDSFIRDMRRIAEEEDLQTTDEAGRGTVRDIRSIKRLGLIFDMQDQSAAGYARWKIDHDPDVIDEFPAYRLSESSANQPRAESFWQRRWNEAGNAVGWQGATRREHVALKTSPIWTALSRFGTPWPPFDYGSTRVLEDVDRAEAESLNLIAPDAIPPRFPQGSDPESFNKTLQASIEGLSPNWIQAITSVFGSNAQTVGDVIKWMV